MLAVLHAARAAVRSLPLALIAGSMIAVALAGCSPLQPWVKPYQREHLADPIMSFDRHPASSAYLDHIYSVRQAARGGTGAVGGGCGCN
jgi:Domain of unknown function (DUF4266)